MKLPEVVVPEFDIEVPGIEEPITFRPFLVKESKLLTLALEGGDILDQVRAVQQVVENCSKGKLKGRDLPLYQLQWIFLKLKSKSVGEVQSFTVTCGNCEGQMNYDMSLNEFEVYGNLEESSKKIEINESTGIVFKYPDALVQASSSQIQDSDLILKCIDYIYNEEELIQADEVDPKDLEEWINELPLEITKNIGDFFEQIPLLGHVLEYKCKECNKENRVVINGYDHFFV